MSSDDSRLRVVRVVELVVWRLPRPVPPTDHGCKCRAVYAADGARVVGLDNEWCKGDQGHLRGRELPYLWQYTNWRSEPAATAGASTKMCRC